MSESSHQNSYSTSFRDVIAYDCINFILKHVASERYAKFLYGCMQLGLHCAADEEIGGIVDMKMSEGEWPSLDIIAKLIHGGV